MLVVILTNIFCTIYCDDVPWQLLITQLSSLTELICAQKTDSNQLSLHKAKKTKNRKWTKTKKLTNSVVPNHLLVSIILCHFTCRKSRSLKNAGRKCGICSLKLPNKHCMCTACVYPLHFVINVYMSSGFTVLQHLLHQQQMSVYVTLWQKCLVPLVGPCILVCFKYYLMILGPANIQLGWKCICFRNDCCSWHLNDETGTKSSR